MRIIDGFDINPFFGYVMSGKYIAPTDPDHIHTLGSLAAQTYLYGHESDEENGGRLFTFQPHWADKSFTSKAYCEIIDPYMAEATRAAGETALKLTGVHLTDARNANNYLDIVYEVPSVYLPDIKIIDPEHETTLALDPEELRPVRLMVTLAAQGFFNRTEANVKLP